MQPHHPVTRLQIAGFLATTILLAASAWALFLFVLLGSLFEATLGFIGMVVAMYLCRVGRKKWNFDRMDSTTGRRLENSGYFLENEADRAFSGFVETLVHVEDQGWENLDLEARTEVREELKSVLEKHPLLVEEILSLGMPDHLRYVARNYLPEHAL